VDDPAEQKPENPLRQPDEEIVLEAENDQAA
jgi:hypothetical protein